MGQLRRNQMLGEWVVVTPKRAKRPFQEKSIECPFCPGQPETEGEWKVLTLDNKYPAFQKEAGLLPLDPDIVLEAPAFGSCKVIIYSPDHDMQIESMNDSQLLAVLNEYVRVFKELDQTRGIAYVMQFENRGKSIGVSLNHPHAQVYALPFIPPRIQKEIHEAQRSWTSDDTCVVCWAIEKELEAGLRIINETENFISLVPFAARLPYEVHIYPRRHVSSLLELEDVLEELGQTIRDVVQRYSKVFDEMGYIMTLHTRPSIGDHPYWHFHIEFYPPWRDRTRIKYLGGIETGAWTYTNDSTPEEKAEELREAI